MSYAILRAPRLIEMFHREERERIAKARIVEREK